MFIKTLHMEYEESFEEFDGRVNQFYMKWMINNTGNSYQ